MQKINSAEAETAQGDFFIYANRKFAKGGFYCWLLGNCETDFSVNQRNLFSEKARLRLESNAAVLIKNSLLANFLKYRRFPTAFC